MRRRLVSVLMVLAILFTLLPSVAVTADAAANKYNKDWRYWSQGASGYTAGGGASMAKSGCRIVAQAKLLREAGITAIKNPDTWFEWMYKNGGVKSKSNVNEIWSTASGDYMMKYLKSLGVSVTRTIVTKGDKNATQWKNAIMNYINQGYYVILERNDRGHQTYVLR